MKMRSFLTICLLAFGLALTMPAFAAGAVDINTADAATLSERLEGIGPAKAAAIVEYRETYGPFQSVEELTAVSGIGTVTLEANRDHLSIGE